MATNARNVTTRRLLQQTMHCVREALSIVENEEDEDCAIDDLKQAQMLIETILNERLRASRR